MDTDSISLAEIKNAHLANLLCCIIYISYLFSDISGDVELPIQSLALDIASPSSQATPLSLCSSSPLKMCHKGVAIVLKPMDRRLAMMRRCMA